MKIDIWKIKKNDAKNPCLKVRKFSILNDFFRCILPNWKKSFKIVFDINEKLMVRTLPLDFKIVKNNFQMC